MRKNEFVSILNDVENLLRKSDISREAILDYMRDLRGRGVGEAGVAPGYLEIATRVYSARRHRDRVFAELHVFRDSVWDILLELYIAQATGRRLTVKAAIIASQSPSTTAFRHIDTIERFGLTVRRRDKVDSRQVFIELTPLGLDMLERTLAGYQQVFE